MKKLQHVITKTVATYSVTAAELRVALGLPADADVFVQVPGGGDWSSTRLEIDSDSLLYVTVQETTREGGEE